MGSHTPIEDLGKLLNQKRGLMKAVYDFSVLGGAVGTLNLVDDNGDVILLPSKAIVTQVYCDVVTAMASAGGTGTIALGVNTTVDLLAAVDADTKSGVFAGIPIGTAGTMVKCTAARHVQATIATEALTAGKLNVFVEFVLSE